VRKLRKHPAYCLPKPRAARRCQFCSPPTRKDAILADNLTRPYLGSWHPAKHLILIERLRRG